MHPPLFLPAPKGPEAVRTQAMLIHEVLGYERDKDGVLVEPPILTVHPDCRDFIRTIAKLPLDPRDANKFDTKGEDHAAQGFAYYLTLRAPEYAPPVMENEVVVARARLDQTSRREAESFDQAIRQAVRRAGMPRLDRR
jgi:hypothetical protein